MKRWFFHGLIFVLVFMLDVRVKASQVVLPPEDQPLQFPKSCMQTDEFCAIEVSPGRRYLWSMKGVQVTLGAGARLARATDGSGVYLGGAILVDADSDWLMKTHFASIQFHAGNKALLWRRGDHVELVALKGVLRVSALGHQVPLDVPSGYQISLAPISRQGLAEMGIPQAALASEVVNRWAQLFDGPKGQFFKQVKGFRQHWSVAVEQASRLHKALVERRLAEVELERRRRAEHRRRVRAENQRLRALYRKKNYLHF